MEIKLNQTMLLKALDWSYDRAIYGGRGLDSASEVAETYLKRKGSLEARVDALIRWQNSRAATSGFLTGLGGVLTMPVTLPINITSVLYVQIRMIAAIAIMGGFDVRNDPVKSLVYVCLCGSGAKDIARTVGLQVGRQLAMGAVRRATRSTVQKRVGSRLLARFTERGVSAWTKVIPGLGGVIGAVLDAMSTDAIGAMAKETFLGSPELAPVRGEVEGRCQGITKKGARCKNKAVTKGYCKIHAS